jgi:hypothetical protein
MILRKRKIALCSAIALILAISTVPGSGDTPGTVRLELSRVLSQEKFIYHSDDGAAGAAEESLFETLMKKLEEKLLAFRDYLAKLLTATSLVAGLIYLLLIAAVAVLAIYIIKRIDLGPGAGRKRPAGADDFFSLDFEKELRRAGGLLEAGRFRESLQAMLGALWLYYNYADVFAYRRSLTNREYLARLGGREEYGLLREIVYRGESAVYAGEEIREDQCREILEDIREIVAR